MTDGYEPGDRARKAILRALARMWRNFEAPPTYRELERELGLSHGAMQFHVTKLRELGHVHESRLWITRAGFELIQAD